MIENFIDHIKMLLESLLITLIQILKDILYYLIDSVVGLALDVLEKVAELMPYLDFNEYYSKLPDEVYNALGALGIGYALNMIIATILFKTFLKVMPFTKLGSK